MVGNIRIAEEVGSYASTPEHRSFVRSTAKVVIASSIMAFATEVEPFHILSLTIGIEVRAVIAKAIIYSKFLFQPNSRPK